MWCKHKWKEISKTILESAFEQMAEKDYYITELDIKVGPHDLFRKAAVIVLTCDNCGRTKIVRIHNPD